MQTWQKFSIAASSNDQQVPTTAIVTGQAVVTLTKWTSVKTADVFRYYQQMKQTRAAEKSSYSYTVLAITDDSDSDC